MSTSKQALSQNERELLELLIKMHHTQHLIPGNKPAPLTDKALDGIIETAKALDKAGMTPSKVLGDKPMELAVRMIVQNMQSKADNSTQKFKEQDILALLSKLSPEQLDKVKKFVKEKTKDDPKLDQQAVEEDLNGLFKKLDKYAAEAVLLKNQKLLPKTPTPGNSKRSEPEDDPGLNVFLTNLTGLLSQQTGSLEVPVLVWNGDLVGIGNRYGLEGNSQLASENSLNTKSDDLGLANDVAERLESLGIKVLTVFLSDDDKKKMSSHLPSPTPDLGVANNENDGWKPKTPFDGMKKGPSPIDD